MISSQSFLLGSLLIWVAFLVALAVTERRSLASFRNRRGIRYRRLTTSRMLRVVAHRPRWRAPWRTRAPAYIRYGEDGPILMLRKPDGSRFTLDGSDAVAPREQDGR